MGTGWWGQVKGNSFNVPSVLELYPLAVPPFYKTTSLTYPQHLLLSISLTCQLFFQSFNFFIKLLDLFVSGQSSSSSRGLQGLCGFCKARDQKSIFKHLNPFSGSHWIY